MNILSEFVGIRRKPQTVGTHTYYFIVSNAQLPKTIEGWFLIMAKKDKVPCPYCGEPINRNAKACPHCGSDEQTGWSNDTYLDGIDLPDDVDYEELRRNEFSEGKKNLSTRTLIVSAVGGLLLLTFIYAIFRGAIF